MAICAACGQDAGDSRFCVSCGASLAGQPPRSGMIDQRLIVGVAVVIFALVVAVVLVVVNRGPDTAGAGGTTASTTAGQAPSSATAQTGDDSGPPSTVVTIGSRTAGSNAPSSPSGQPQLVVAVAVSATSTAAESVDDQGNPISYAPANAVDGDLATAWRAAAGDGIGQELVLQLPKRYALTSVGLVPGYNKVDGATGKDRFRQNRRISRVTWTFDDGSSVGQDFKDDRTLQTIQVNSTTGSVRIKIVSSIPPDDATDPREFIAISEVSFQGVSD